MPDQEQIDQQRQRLEVYRQTLAMLLDQQARLGTAHTPPGVIHDIR